MNPTCATTSLFGGLLWFAACLPVHVAFSRSFLADYVFNGFSTCSDRLQTDDQVCFSRLQKKTRPWNPPFKAPLKSWPPKPPPRRQAGASRREGSVDRGFGSSSMVMMEGGATWLEGDLLHLAPRREATDGSDRRTKGGMGSHALGVANSEAVFPRKHCIGCFFYNGNLGKSRIGIEDLGGEPVTFGSFQVPLGGKPFGQLVAVNHSMHC